MTKIQYYVVTRGGVDDVLFRTIEDDDERLWAEYLAVGGRWIERAELFRHVNDVSCDKVTVEQAQKIATRWGQGL